MTRTHIPSLPLPPAETSIYLSDLLGRSLVDPQGRRLGRLQDVVARVVGPAPALVVRLVVRRGRRDMILPIEDVAHLASRATPFVLVTAQPAGGPLVRGATEVLLGRAVMDHEVIDLRGPRIVRVNDLLVGAAAPAGGDERWHVQGGDTGAHALLRRLFPRAVRPRPRGTHVVQWADIEFLASTISGGRLVPDHTRLGRSHPVAIARVVEALPCPQAAEIVASLAAEVAAATLGALVAEKQAPVLAALDPARAADILDRMAPDDAADLVAALAPENASAVVPRMEPAQGAAVQALLPYAPDTAGGLMTTDYVLAPVWLRVGEAAAYLRPQLQRADPAGVIYVSADAQERRLLGVLALRDLDVADPALRLGDIMTPARHRVLPGAAVPVVTQIMSAYHLLALPVTAPDGRLLGSVSVDDVLNAILPADLRRCLPRMFS